MTCTYNLILPATAAVVYKCPGPMGQIKGLHGPDLTHGPYI